MISIMDFKKILRAHKKSVTPEREMLFKKMREYHIFSARDLEENFSEIGRASIYRTMKLFCEVWILRRITLEAWVEQYEINSHENHHEHMKCESCGTVFSFNSDFLCKLLWQTAKKHHFSLREHSINLFGTCKNCS